MVLLLGLGMGQTIAFADKLPEQPTNAQQKGHVAYLESLYGDRKTDEILKDYGRPSTARTPEEERVIAKSVPVEQTPYTVPNAWPTSVQPPKFSTLRIGDLFTVNGQRYIANRFVKIANADMLIAYPVMPNGSVLDTMPRYFYL